MNLSTLKTSMQNYFAAIKDRLDNHKHDDRYYNKGDVVPEADVFVGDVSSDNYSSGVSGWLIRQNGYAEFNEAVIRGNIDASSITINGEAPYSGISVDVTAVDWVQNNSRWGSGTLLNQSFTRTGTASINEVPGGALLNVSIPNNAETTLYYRRYSQDAVTNDREGATSTYITTETIYGITYRVRTRIRVWVDDNLIHETDINLANTDNSTSNKTNTISTGELNVPGVEYTYPSYKATSTVKVEVYSECYAALGSEVGSSSYEGGSGVGYPARSDGSIDVNTRQLTGNLSRLGS